MKLNYMTNLLIPPQAYTKNTPISLAQNIIKLPCALLARDVLPPFYHYSSSTVKGSALSTCSITDYISISIVLFLSLFSNSFLYLNIFILLVHMIIQNSGVCCYVFVHAHNTIWSRSFPSTSSFLFSDPLLASFLFLKTHPHLYFSFFLCIFYI